MNLEGHETVCKYGMLTDSHLHLRQLCASGPVLLVLALAHQQL